MADPQKGIATQLANIEAKTKKKLPELICLVKDSGLEKHGEIRDMLKSTLGLGHGDANSLAHAARQALDPALAVAKEATPDQAVDSLYTGPKATLRPIHDALMKEILKMGAFEVAPKKTYLSLRRKKQFAMIGPATNTRVEVGLNAKNLKGSARLVEQPPKSMCQYLVKLTQANEVDKELIAWIRAAYDSAG